MKVALLSESPADEAVLRELVAAVLGEGRYVWWTQAAWIGWALAAAIPLFLAGVGFIVYALKHPIRA